MTDQSLGLLTNNSRLSRVRAAATHWLRWIELSPMAAWSIVWLIAAMLSRYFWLEEGNLENILFTAAVTFAMISALVLVSRRVLFATVLVALLVLVIITVAWIKRSLMNMVVHAYDLFFYFSSWSTVSFLWSDQRRYVLGFAGALLAVAFVAWLTYHADSTRIPRKRAGLAMLMCIILAIVGAETKGERRHMQFYYSALYLSSFYASWGETMEALFRGALLEAAPAADGAPFVIPTTCRTKTKPPHVILIHQESVVQPSLFPTLLYDNSVDPFFRSFDDQLHALQVETYGGASWLTEFSLLAGVSTHSFGSMRQFVQTFTQGRLKDTLPQVFERCGYRNVVFYPMLKNFVSNDRFYNSIGLKEIFDLRAQGAPTAQERDRFYYTNALAEMQRYFSGPHKPLFLYIQTMAAHWPYDYKFEPNLVVPGGGPGTDPEMSEYLRRVAMAKIDYEFLVSELRRLFPREQFLIVHYGDHHPSATRTLLGFKEDTEVEDVNLDSDSLGFRTYYAVHGLNYHVPPLPPYETLHVPYLGSLILQLARLPLSDSHRERLRLMSICKGRYYSCSKREEILLFHRRLIDAGVMAAR